MKRILFIVALFTGIYSNGQKTSELSAASYPTGAELINVVQGGTNKKMTVNQIASLGGRYWVTAYGAIADDNTSDDAAFTACLAAIYAAGGGKMCVPDGVFNVTNVTFPAINPAGGSGQMTIEVEGAFHPTGIFGTLGSASQPATGSIIKSSSTSGAVINVVSYNPGGGVGERFSGLRLVMRNITIRSYDNPNIKGVDAGYALYLKMEDCMVDNGMYTVDGIQVTHSNAIGIVTPERYNGAQTQLINVVVNGYYTGILVNEHTEGHGVSIWGCGNGMQFVTSDQSSYFSHLLIARTVGAIYVTGYHVFRIDAMQIERAASGWQMSSAEVTDVSNLAVGSIEYQINTGAGSANGDIVKNGGVNLVSGKIGRLPEWTTAGRPTLSGGSFFGKNSTTGNLEYWNGSTITVK